MGSKDNDSCELGMVEIIETFAKFKTRMHLIIIIIVA